MKRVMVVVASLLLAYCVPSFAYLSEGKTIEGSQKELRLGKNDQFGPGPLVVQEGHGKYAEMAARGSLFYCANAAGTSVTTQAGLSATTPMLTLYNPTSSGKNLVILEVNVTPTAAPAAAAGLIVAISTAQANTPSATTAGVIQNALLGNTGTGVAQCYRVATLQGAPIGFRYFGGTTGAAAISGAMFTDPTDGKIIVSPGTAISIQTTSAVAGIGHFLYEEVPL